MKISKACKQIQSTSLSDLLSKSGLRDLCCKLGKSGECRDPSLLLSTVHTSTIRASKYNTLEILVILTLRA